MAKFDKKSGKQRPPRPKFNSIKFLRSLASQQRPHSRMRVMTFSDEPGEPGRLQPTYQNPAAHTINLEFNQTFLQQHEEMRRKQQSDKDQRFLMRVTQLKSQAQFDLERRPDSRGLRPVSGQAMQALEESIGRLSSKFYSFYQSAGHGSSTGSSKTPNSSCSPLKKPAVRVRPGVFCAEQEDESYYKTIVDSLSTRERCKSQGAQVRI